MYGMNELNGREKNLSLFDCFLCGNSCTQKACAPSPWQVAKVCSVLDENTEDDEPQASFTCRSTKFWEATAPSCRAVVYMTNALQKQLHPQPFGFGWSCSNHSNFQRSTRSVVATVSWLQHYFWHCQPQCPLDMLKCLQMPNSGSNHVSLPVKNKYPRFFIIYMYIYFFFTKLLFAKIISLWCWPTLVKLTASSVKQIVPI